MFDFSRRNRRDNERGDENPRIIVTSPPRQSQPILSSAGYSVFSFATFSIWTIILVMVWVLRAEIALSENLVSAIASSSVELAALSLATLGVLNELNKEDKWFKVGLFLVSFFFVIVVLVGYAIALTWRPEYGEVHELRLLLLRSSLLRH